MVGSCLYVNSRNNNIAQSAIKPYSFFRNLTSLSTWTAMKLILQRQFPVISKIELLEYKTLLKEHLSTNMIGLDF